MACPYPITTGYKGNNVVTEWPEFDTLEESRDGAGTKLNQTADLVAHLLSDVRAGHVTEYSDETGQMVFPPLSDGEPGPSTRKILISHEFPMQSFTISTVSVCCIPTYRS